MYWLSSVTFPVFERRDDRSKKQYIELKKDVYMGVGNDAMDERQS